MKQQAIRDRLDRGNLRWRQRQDESAALRLHTARNGQEPYAIVVACSDSRVIPEQLFDAGLGELFVIRVAGNVLDRHQLGSIEYAAAHLHCRLILVLGHTGCGAIGAALSGGGEGSIAYITDEILRAVGEVRDPDLACRLNVQHAVETIRREFAEHPEIPMADTDVLGAIYDIGSGDIRWLQ